MRFNHVFYSLLLLCVISTFVLPARFSEAVRPKIGGLFTPVAAPSRGIVAWATGRGSQEPKKDDRPADVIVKENEELRNANIALVSEVAELRRISGERASVGLLKDQCLAASVIGSDTGTRDSLVLRGNLSGAPDGLYVLYEHNVVGTLVSGRAGAQVRLVTDKQSRIRARFGSFRSVEADSKPGTTQPAVAETRFVPYKLSEVLVEGQGNGKMMSRNIPLADVRREGLKSGDWVVASDPDWPELNDRRIGVVQEIRTADHMMAEIEIRPERDLMRLREVMVLTKKK